MTPEFSRTLLRSSWWAILLGLGIEGLQLAVAAAAGDSPLIDQRAVVAEAAQKVSWSYIVCVALACGTVGTRDAPPRIGLLGLLAAPLAFTVARIVHKSVGQALMVTSATGSGAAPWLLAVVKAAQYAVFGYLVARLVRRPEPRVSRFAALGFGIGALFGGFALWLQHSLSPAGLQPAALLARGVNEVLFPVGCACVLWATGVVAKPAT